MANNDNGYLVGWRRTATKGLAKIFNVDHERVYDASISVLSRPYKNSMGVANYPNFKFNGFHWTEIGNVIVVYKINDEKKLVSIQAAFSAVTGFAMKRFYGEYDPMD
ncbi:hypothetical protein L1N85_08715 [Paenibacillus alkaliterrae]|uniref:hypothetical protein n=1 Tax=Paenibacillus alkaliterrae TaxID=320909 RepID=UPI001F28634B|nr:hypothetical protein [Paenibacillus alkaliterrae]MCF2938515.1 hypothetical protein [Paenibacillus alkaliterrae]